MNKNQNQNQNKSNDSHLKVFFGAQFSIQQEKAKQQYQNLEKLSLGKTVANLHNIYVEHNYKEKQTDKNKQMEKIRHYFRKYQPIYFNNVDMKNFHYNTKNVKIKKYKEANYYGEVDLQTGRKHGLGIMVYNNNKIYEGQWKNDQKCGKGYEKFTDGSVYQGDYLQGKPQGIGKLVHHNLQFYQGEWKNGLKNGKGYWRGPKGDSYLGQWVNGKAQGYGVHTWSNGDKYEGQFKDCLKHGDGIQKFSNGDIYKGTYENGKPSGFGQYFWANKSFFKGYFKNGLRSGHGVWKKGPGRNDKYQGEYQNDKKWGLGVFTWASGNIYKGNYNGDVRNGYGQMYWTDGSYYKGEWVNGLQHGKGQILIPTIGFRKGLFQNNQIIQIEQEQLIQQNQTSESKLSQKLQTLNNKIDKKLSTKKSQSQLSITSKNKLKTNFSKLMGSKQSNIINEEKNKEQSARKAEKSNNFRMKTQSVQGKSKKYQNKTALRNIGDNLVKKQGQDMKNFKKYSGQQIFVQPTLKNLKERHSFYQKRVANSKNISSFFNGLNNKMHESNFKQQQFNKNDGISIKKDSKKKDRLLHSSFYIHRFKHTKMSNKDNQNNQETQIENNFGKVNLKNHNVNLNQSNQNRMRASSLIKNKKKFDSDRYSQKHL